MIFVNAVVGVPNDLDFRMHLRNQFYAVGFGDLKTKMEEFAVGSEILKRQLEKFSDEMAADWIEWEAFFENLKQDEWCIHYEFN
jgi:hypothetical protein